MQKYPTLYTRDDRGSLRIWYIERDGAKYRTVSGVDGGAKLKITDWWEAEATNIGRADHRDAEAQAHFEIMSRYTQKRQRRYVDNRDHAKKTHIVEPMLAVNWSDITPSNRLIVGKSCFSQPKLDGIRCLIGADFMLSRAGKIIPSCPHILKSLAPFFKENPYLILDGELYNHEFRDDFNVLSSLITKKLPKEKDLKETKKLIQYHVYDLIGQREKFEDRFDWILNQSLPDCVVPVRTNEITNLRQLDDMYGEYLKEGYEGQMIRLNEYYEHKRSGFLIKRKEFFDREFTVIEVVEGKGDWSGRAKSVVCKTMSGQTFDAGIRGDYKFTENLLKRAKAGKLPKAATVRYPNLTPRGVPRFPVAISFWNGKRDM
jgi:DNA ligase 1